MGALLWELLLDLLREFLRDLMSHPGSPDEPPLEDET
jgi:hypothetical protein